MVPDSARIASAILASVSIAGRPSAAPPSITPLLGGEVRDLLVGVVGDGLGRHARAGRPAGRCAAILSATAGVVALDHDEVRHRPARHGRGTRRARQSRTRPPGCAVSPGVSCCSGTATTSRRTPEVGRGPARRSARAIAWKASKSVRVSQRRVDRRGEGVHERVHVGGVEVVLLVPGGGRAARRRTAGSSWSSGSPATAAGRACPRGGSSSRQATSRGLRSGGVCSRLQVVVRAEQVPQEVLVALGRRAEQVGPPQREARAASSAARPGPRWRTAAGRPAAAPATCAGDVGARRRGLVGQVERVAVELRVGRHPAQPGRQRDGVDGVHARRTCPRPSGEVSASAR